MKKKRCFFITLFFLCLVIFFLPVERTYGEQNEDIKSSLKIPDLNHTQILSLRNGTKINGRIIEIEESEIRFQSEFGSHSIPIANIKEIEEVLLRAKFGEEFWLVVLLIVLLGSLFILMILWSHRLDKASYLGQVYKDSVFDFELKRLSANYKEKKYNGGYRLEAEAEVEAEAKSKKPTAPEWWSPRTGTGNGRSSRTPELDEAQEKELKEYFEIRDDWEKKISLKAKKSYEDDLKKAETEATKRSKSAMGVDISVLRGRGPKFVLEFTAVVVIIFAAVILGILHILGTQQIGTLLAAIAGYVLGRATTSDSSTRSEAVSEETEVPPSPKVLPQKIQIETISDIESKLRKIVREEFEAKVSKQTTEKTSESKSGKVDES